jgi:hypothetical protein
VPILVVLGNPPYNAFAGTSPEEEQGLVDPYKEGLSKAWGIKKFNLDELYVRFMRLAQRRITEGTKQGVVCYISSFSYLADPSFVVMRQRLLNDFDNIWIDCLNGDSRETGKKTPDGEPDPSVFSTKFNTVGIRLGTTIGLFTRKLAHQPASTVRYRDFWGRTKRQDLLNDLSEKEQQRPYKPATPSKDNRFSFRPEEVSSAFRLWPKIVELCELAPTPGLQEMRFGALISLDKDALFQHMTAYLDPARSWSEVSAMASGPVRDAGRFSAQGARDNLLKKKEKVAMENIRRYSLYPFDNRWAYWSSMRPMWNEPRPALVAHAFSGNNFFITRMSAERPTEGIPATVTTALPDYHLLRPNVVAIPFTVEYHGDGLFAAERRANLSAAARGYLKFLGLGDPDSQPNVAQLLWLHALAVCFSPRYISEHRDGILSDWPRIPLPGNRSALESSAELGKRLSALLDPDTPIPEVTQGKVTPPLQIFGALSRVDNKPLGPSDLTISGGWGHRTSAGIVMPGAGRVKQRPYTPDEAGQIDIRAIELLGPPLDVMLNDIAMWRAVPTKVWDFRIGGYQIIKKWLSYRDQSVLGRPLMKEEAREVSGMVRRLAAILLMTDQLDKNYACASDDVFEWPRAPKT